MIHDAPIKSIDDLAEFLEPLIDITTCDRTSLTNLKLNHKEIIDKLNYTGRPVLLTISGQTLLLGDARIYFDLETKRRCLFSQFKSVEEALGPTGVAEVSDPLFIELEGMKAHIASLEGDIKEEKYCVKKKQREIEDEKSSLKKKERELKDARLRTNILMAGLRKATTGASEQMPK